MGVIRSVRRPSAPPIRARKKRKALEYRFGDTQHPPLFAAGVLASLQIRLSWPENSRPSRRAGFLERHAVRQAVPHFQPGHGSVADTVKLFKQSHHAFFEDEVCQMGFPAPCVRPREPLVPIQGGRGLTSGSPPTMTRCFSRP